MLLLGLPPATAAAQTDGGTSSAAGQRLETRWSVKGTGVFGRPSQAGLWRIRLEPTVRLGPRASIELAYEHRVRATSDEAALDGSGLPVLPSQAAPPYRITPLDWEIASGGHTAWHREIDRAVVHLPLRQARLSVGRQAIGWGRGVVFGAVDLFAPFSPFEVDREWRRGADAIRLDVPLSTLASADVVAAFGVRADASAYAARLRGYAGTIDVEAVGGWRARDVFGGATTSFVAGQAEVHAELAVFRTPAAIGSSVFGTERTVVKLVVGGSSRLPFGNGLLTYVEYHYSGFGAPSAEDLAAYLADPAFVARYVRGDTQVLTRHALAVIGSYEWSPLVASSAMVIQEPTDASGVLTPSLTLTFGDHWSLLASVYLVYGRGRTGSSPGSAYGAAPNTMLVQVRVYR
jgi:hypothetical protein